MSSAPFAICSLGCAPMRREPTHVSEMTNQLLFGERCRVLERHREFLRVIADFDAYEGWVDGRQFLPLEGNDPTSWVLADELTATATSDHRTLHLPLGSRLLEFDDGWFTLGDERFRYQGAIREMSRADNAEALLNYARRYLHAPYLWGGRTPWGIDCSGFVQLVFRAFGIPLWRDSTQQILQGESIATLEETRPGDLAFFSGAGNHVGIIQESGKIIHASGSVRVDRLDQTGIWNLQTGENTHQTTAFRRIL